MEIRGKKYVWRLEDMDATLLIALSVLFVGLLAAGLWSVLSIASALWGQV